MSDENLTAPYVLQYDYRRSCGPVIGRFLAALKEGRIEGTRSPSGRVIVPPVEYDPETGAATRDFVTLPPTGTVQTWTWVSAPRPTHPLPRPFAFALIKLDGADTAFLHAVDANDPSRMRSGLRVRAKFASERKGHIRDLECFVLGEDASEWLPASSATGEIIKGFVSPVRLQYTVNAGRASSRFLRGLLERRILGQRCPVCKKVNVPPRGACPTCGVPTEEDVQLSETGTVTTFCIININFDAKARALPYACASILLDGSDTTLFHLIQEMNPAELRMGTRVRAVWADEPLPSLESIAHFKPTGEPDAPFESYREHL
jgi:uncharacterized OB-fold protein